MTHDDPRITAWALGEGTAEERAEVEALLAADPALRAEAEALRDAAGSLKDGLAAEPVPALDTAHRGAVEAALTGAPVAPAPSLRFLRVSPEFGAVAATLLLTLGLAVGGVAGGVEFRTPESVAEYWGRQGIPAAGVVSQAEGEFQIFDPSTLRSIDGRVFHTKGVGGGGGGAGGKFNHSAVTIPPNVRVGVTGTLSARLADLKSIGYLNTAAPGEVELPGFDKFTVGGGISDQVIYIPRQTAGESTTESFSPIVENAFVRPVGDAALSTFSVDVDTAAYSIVRRCLLEQGRIPPPGALRIEELVNYFPYAYEGPAGSAPFAVRVDAASCPWNPKHRLVRVALQGRRIEEPERPAANLVLLLDVSGSMEQPNKLPLLKKSIALLAERLTARDRIAMVVYAGASGLALPPTSGDRKDTILAALENLSAGGSTNGAAGIEQAYQVASENFIRGGINRVVLATDGDFNVGVSDPSALVKMVEEKAKSGVFLTALGYGMDNLKDATLEQLADRGNGNYGYVDNLNEARKVLVDQGMGTLHAIAKDVKIQVEFNPARVAAFRLLGYENRALAAQDFADDAKDAGEIGAGHAVTAFYEVVPAGESVPGSAVDALRYQRPGDFAGSTESMVVKLRWKEPEGSTSTLLEVPFEDAGLAFDAADSDFRFGAAVAAFGMALRASEHRGSATLPLVREIAAGALSDDPGGWRAEFLTLVDRAATLNR